MAFIGFVADSEDAGGLIQVAGDSGTPIEANEFPTYTIYSASGTAMSNGTGTATFLNATGLTPNGTPITGATNASPIVISSVGHGLLTGMQITLSGANGNTAANGEWIITRIGADTFSLYTAAGAASVGNGAWTNGGWWRRTGLYKWSHTVSSGDGYEAGQTYIVIINALIDSGSPATEVTVVGDDSFVYTG